MAAGDMEHFRSIYTPDVVKRQPGSNQTSSEYKESTTSSGFTGSCSSCRAALSAELKSGTTEGDKVITVHRAKAEREGKTLDADESIEFTFSGDKISVLDLTSTDEAAEDAFWG